jgi:hypothetical protein
MHIKRIISAASAGLLIALTVPAAAFAATSAPVVVYDATTNPLPPNVASEGFEATSTSQFGDYVHLAGTARNLNTVSVTMSNWALYSEYANDPRYTADTNNWKHPITVNVFSNHLNVNGEPDTLLATKTQDVTIPWRPTADPTCPTPTAYKVGETCYNGKAFTASFDLGNSNVTLPNDVIVGFAYNTADYGAAPLHTPGPYNSLNVGIPTDQPVTVGTDDNVDNVFTDTTYPGYTAGFKQDTGWKPNGTVALKITATEATQPVTPKMPTSKEDCKNGGYKNLVDDKGNKFSNQGQCVSFANHPKRSTVQLDSKNIEGVNIPTIKGDKYSVTVKGTWTNRPGEIVDAECTSFDGGKWKNAVNGKYSADLLDVQVNKKVTNWGACDKEHEYTHIINADGTDINLRVFDGDAKNNVQIPEWYGDNNGVLTVDIIRFPKQ